MSKFSGSCRGCGGWLTTMPENEHDNRGGVSVRCGRCGTITRLRPDGVSAYKPACPWLIPLSREQREVEA